MSNRVAYHALARHLSTLDITATCADLADSLVEFADCDVGLKDALLAAVRALPPEAGWIDGLFVVCDVLKADNGRFVPAIMMEWTLVNV